MRVSPNFLDEIRARVPVSQVVGRKVSLKKAGREWKGLSPFKVEKTPSFTVNDQKGFYHCFATGEHGDIFTFLMKTEGLEFMEAVERLAGEAGLEMPKQAERSPDEDNRRDRAYRLLEASAKFFEDCLRGGAGGEARRYLDKRGLKPETLATFRLGFAPNSRTALRDHLKAQGFTPAEMAITGMQIAGEDIPEPYDRFRNRVMFPIQDMKGRVIAFGGRALDKDAPAKYLNSPETPLFHKGSVLFNASRARPLAHDRDRIIVVEGYMDVVALSEAGFGEAVAPLGTALTEDQTTLLWRFVPEPTLCFDGDAAGLKAAYRAVDTVMPNLKPGMSVNFAFLPDGLDPDDLIRQRGREAFADILANTQPLIDVLWQRELASGRTDTPEHRAALEARLRGIAASIAEPTVRGYYERELRDRLYLLGRATSGRGGGGGPGQRRGAGGQPGPAGGSRGAGGPAGLTGSYYASGGGGGGYGRPAPNWRDTERDRLSGRPARRPNPFDRGPPPVPQASQELSSLSHSVSPREALIVKTLLNHPWLIDEHSETIAELPFASVALAALRDQILAIHAMSNSLDSATLHTQLTKTGVAKVVDLVARTITHASDRFAEPDASATDVETAWVHVLALHQRQDALQRMLKAAEETWDRECSQESWERLLDVKRQIAHDIALDDMDTVIAGPGADEPFGQQAGGAGALLPGPIGKEAG